MYKNVKGFYKIYFYVFYFTFNTRCVLKQPYARFEGESIWDLLFLLFKSHLTLCPDRYALCVNSYNRKTDETVHQFHHRWFHNHL